MVSLRPLPLHDHWPLQRLLLCGVSNGFSPLHELWHFSAFPPVWGHHLYMVGHASSSKVSALSIMKIYKKQY